MKRTGRPPLDPTDRSVPVHVKMPPKQYDETFERAREARCTVPEMLRRDNLAASKRRNPK